MVNYIRACFCLHRYLNFSDLIPILEALTYYGCHPIGSPQTNLGGWINQKIEWNIHNVTYEARLFQLSPNIENQFLVSFDIDEFVFLPDRKISYKPNNDPLFAAYKSIIIDLVKQLKPEIGLIDYDEDLLCGEISKTPIVAWGNFFSDELLKLLKQEEKTKITNIVDELIYIKDIGILTFIHPLLVNQAWTERHNKLDKMIRPYLDRKFQ